MGTFPLVPIIDAPVSQDDSLAAQAARNRLLDRLVVMERLAAKVVTVMTRGASGGSMCLSKL